MFQIFGLSRDQFQGCAEDWQRCTDDLALCVQQMARAVAAGRSAMNSTSRLFHGDGSDYDVNASATVFYDKDGGPLRMLGCFDHRAQAHGARAGYELLRVTCTSIGDAVITTDVRGRVQWLNPVAEHDRLAQCRSLRPSLERCFPHRGRGHRPARDVPR